MSTSIKVRPYQGIVVPDAYDMKKYVDDKSTKPTDYVVNIEQDDITKLWTVNEIEDDEEKSFTIDNMMTTDSAQTIVSPKRFTDKITVGGETVSQDRLILDDDNIFISSADLGTDITIDPSTFKASSDYTFEINDGSSNSKLKLTTSDIFWNNYHILNTTDIIDALNSTATDKALSANQGKILNDKFGSYVAKAGDTMTGALKHSGTSTCALSSDTNTDYIKISGGSDAAYGGTIFLYGGSESSNPGRISLRTSTGTGYGPMLDLYKDGTATWNSNYLVTSGSTSLGGTLKPLYLTNGVLKEGTQLYNKNMTVNGTNYGHIRTSNANAFSIYAPTSAGTSGQILQSSGGVPTWVNGRASITPTISWASGFSAVSGSIKAVRLTTGIYYIRLAFTCSSALSANTEYKPITSLKLENKIPIYRSVLAGSFGNNTSAIGCTNNAGGSLFINPTQSISANQEIRLAGIIATEE